MRQGWRAGAAALVAMAAVAAVAVVLLNNDADHVLEERGAPAPQVAGVEMDQAVFLAKVKAATQSAVLNEVGDTVRKLVQEGARDSQAHLEFIKAAGTRLEQKRWLRQRLHEHDVAQDTHKGPKDAIAPETAMVATTRDVQDSPAADAALLGSGFKAAQDLHLLQARVRMQQRVRRLAKNTALSAVSASTKVSTGATAQVHSMVEQAVAAAGKLEEKQQAMAGAVVQLVAASKNAAKKVRKTERATRQRMQDALLAEKDDIRLVKKQALVQHSQDLEVALADEKLHEHQMRVSHIHTMQRLKSHVLRAMERAQKAKMQAAVATRKMTLSQQLARRASKASKADLAAKKKAQGFVLKAHHSLKASTLRVEALRRAAAKAEAHEKSSKAAQKAAEAHLITLQVKAKKMVRAANRRTRLQETKRRESDARTKKNVKLLIKKFNQQKAISKRVAEAMVDKAEAIAATAMQTKLAKLKKAEEAKMAKAKHVEDLKMVAVEKKTAESAAEQLMEAHEHTEVTKAKLIAKYTGSVPPGLGRRATAAAEKETVEVKAARKAKIQAASKPLKTVYLGCFSDRVEKRDLPHLMTEDAASPAECAAMCHATNTAYAYSGLQHGKQCFCGQTYGSYGHEPPSTCFIQCRKDKAQKCGGINRNSIYQLH
jgi:hypothetical protein